MIMDNAWGYNMEREQNNIKGFTLTELLMVVVILAILVSFAIPTFFDLLSTRRLQLASETLYNDLLIAHSEAIKKEDRVYFSFTDGTNWCYGINNGSTCNCQIANSCLFNGTEKTINSTEFTNVTLDDTGFGGNTDTTFEPIRGTANNTGTLKLSSNGKDVNISINKMGYVKICSNDLKRYKAC